MNRLSCLADTDAARLARFAELAILDTPPEREFDSIVALACAQFGTATGAVSLIDDRRTWFKALIGFDARELPREQTFCAHALLNDGLTVIEDAALDPVFADNALVTGEAHVRFYAGAPLRFSPPDGAVPVTLGMLCIIDRQPRRFDGAERIQLRALADLVETLIGARAAVARAGRLSQEVSDYAQRVERANRQLRQAERMARIGSWRLDLATSTVTWSDEVRAIHQIAAGQEPTLDEALSFYPEHERARIAGLVECAVTTGNPYEFESDFVTAAGALRRVHCMGEVELDHGTPVALIGVFQDITQRHLNEQLLRRAAVTDPLTGLPNRALFEERLAQLARERPASAADYALLLIDLDGFKSMNDTLGHHAGDEVLRVIGRKLQGRSYRDHFVARLGGDEFVMLVESGATPATVAALVRQILRDLRYTTSEGQAVCSISATVGAAISGDIAIARQTLQQADLALYAAKRAERGTGRLHGQQRTIRSGLADLPHRCDAQRAA